MSEHIVVPRELLGSLLDSDECWFDHHGGCQAHGYLRLEPGQKCPQQEAREILSSPKADIRAALLSDAAVEAAALGTLAACDPWAEHTWEEMSDVARKTALDATRAGITAAIKQAMGEGT